MKRRQVITGLLAFTAAGMLPRPMWQSMDTQEYESLLGDIGVDDIDPPQIDPVSDHENRLIDDSDYSEVAQAVDNSKVETLVAEKRDNLAAVTQSQPSDNIDSPSLDSPAVQARASSPVGVDPSKTTSASYTSQAGDQQERNPTTSTDTLNVVAKRESAKASQLASADEVQSAAAKANNHKINKNIDFERDYDDDIFVSPNEKVLLHSVAIRLKHLQSTIGYGNFNIVSFDDALKFAKRFNKVGTFSPLEIEFIEKLFATEANIYGFYGDKVTRSLTSTFFKKDVYKVPHTGHYLLRDQSLAYYEKIRKSVGGKIILTSGIRSNVKQLHLFLAKVIRVNGNISRASRSLAPPGYSYHGIGDFDVGRVGWGGKNFTDAFAQTDEFKRMQDLGFIDIRYDHGNELGVRFEPWHIKVV